MPPGAFGLHPYRCQVQLFRPEARDKFGCQDDRPSDARVGGGVERGWGGAAGRRVMAPGRPCHHTGRP